MNQRPTGITVLALLDLIGAVIGVLAIFAIALMPTSGYSELDQILMAYKLIMMGLLVLSMIIGAVRGWALWTLQPWGRTLLIVTSIIGLLAFPIGTVVSIVILWYAWQPHVKAAFTTGPIQWRRGKGISGPETGTEQNETTPYQLPPPPPPLPPALGAWLVNERSGQNYQLRAGSTRLGRAALNELVLDDASISREQALVRAEGGSFTLYDRGSRYGTYVNDCKVEGPVILRHGDVIRMGDTLLRLVCGE